MFTMHQSSYRPTFSLPGTDKRLSKRFDLLLGRFLANPSESIPKSLNNDWAAIKSAYRFFHNVQVTDEKLISEASSATARKLRETGGLAIIAHDTTHIDYSGLSVEGLGMNATNESTKGFLLHSSLALTEDGVPLGMLAQSIWTREEASGNDSARRRQLPIEEKESYKWLRSFRESQSALPEGVRGVSVCDREADIYELLCSMEERKHDYVVRSSYNRKLAGGILLESKLGSQPVLARYEYEVQRVHESHPKRTASMALRACEMEIARPEAKTKLAYPESVKLNVVSVTEETPGVAEEDRISWTLLTSLPADSVERAMKVVGIYKHRWKIERFHYVLKSGCNVEKKQLKTVHSLKNMLAFFSIVAYKLLWLKYEAQASPDQSCEAVLSKTEWQALCCRDSKTAVPPPEPPSLARAAVMIAKLGGFMARKSDGFPGVKAIWDGLKRLHDTHETFLIFMQDKGGNSCG
jgi:hypothetical protein